MPGPIPGMRLASSMGSVSTDALRGAGEDQELGKAGRNGGGGVCHVEVEGADRVGAPPGGVCCCRTVGRCGTGDEPKVEGDAGVGTGGRTRSRGLGSGTFSACASSLDGAETIAGPTSDDHHLVTSSPTTPSPSASGALAPSTRPTKASPPTTTGQGTLAAGPVDKGLGTSRTVCGPDGATRPATDSDRQQPGHERNSLTQAR